MLIHCLPFLVAWTWLDVVVNVRFPGKEPAFWYFLPALDVVVLLALVGWVAPREPRRARPWLWAVAGLLSLIRVFRLADGIALRHLHRPFNFYFDLALVPEFVRLLIETLEPGWFVLAVVGFVVGLSLVTWFSFTALRFAQAALMGPRNGWLFVGVTLVAAGLSWIPQSKKLESVTAGWFGDSAISTIAQQVAFIQRAPRYIEARRETTARAQAALASVPTDLSELQGVDVHLIYVESYGQTVLDSPRYAATLQRQYTAMSTTLEQAGWSMVSAIMDAPSYGGSSWLAHRTLATGMSITNQLDYDLLDNLYPLTLASFFRAVGHRTVLVQPGTKRPWSPGHFTDYDQKYRAADFEYRGPSFNWAPLPDQFTLDFVWRREITQAHSPLFIEYALVSSHLPWDRIPPVVSDWASLGDGTIYAHLPLNEHAVSWLSLDSAHAAYLDSIVYDLQVLEGFLTRLDQRPALVVVLGDHQPTSEVTDDDPRFGVPIHVLSRSSDLLEPFLKLGYQPGLSPNIASPHLAMQDLLHHVLRGFSRGQGASG